jgi:flagellin-like protein
MQLKEFITADDRAVSPVIGVILMVAITVILAAVIGTFVLGLGENVQSNSPSASFGFDLEEGTTGGTGDLTGGGGADGLLTITHESGDTVKSARIEVVDDDGNSVTGNTLFSGPTDITAGDTATVDIDTNDEIRIVWSSQGGSNSATLGTFSGPDA